MGTKVQREVAAMETERELQDRESFAYSFTAVTPLPRAMSDTK